MSTAKRSSCSRVPILAHLVTMETLLGGQRPLPLAHCALAAHSTRLPAAKACTLASRARAVPTGLLLFLRTFHVVPLVQRARLVRGAALRTPPNASRARPARPRSRTPPFPSASAYSANPARTLCLDNNLACPSPAKNALPAHGLRFVAPRARTIAQAVPSGRIASVRALFLRQRARRALERRSRTRRVHPHATRVRPDGRRKSAPLPPFPTALHARRALT